MAVSLVRRAAIGMIAFSIVGIVALWIAIEALAVHERETVIEDVIHDNMNLARVFEEHTVRTIGYIDEKLQTLKNRFEAEGERFDLMGFYRSMPINSAAIRNAVITDDTGTIILGSQFSPSLSLADRPHINVHFQQDSGQIFIGSPVQARINGQWSIVVSRRANRPDGSLLGVVAIAVDPSYFSSFYQDLHLGRQADVALIGQDGIVRVRLMDPDRSLGADMAGGEVFRQFSRSSEGAYIANSELDGVSRISTYRPVKGLPLIVMVGTGAEEALASVNGRIRIFRTVAALASITIMIFAGTLITLGTRDMRERRKAAEKLQESEARLRGFLVASPDAIIVINDAGHIVLASERIEMMFGYKPEELVGGPLGVLLPERIRAIHDGYVASYLRAPQVREMGVGIELQARRKDGSEFPTEISLSPYRCALGLFVIAAVRDITRRRQAQAEVLLSEMRFRSAFDAAGHGMTWVGLDDRFLKVNPAFCRMTGYSEAELLSRTHIDITHPDDIAENAINTRRLAMGEISDFQMEKRYLCKDGRTIWVQLNAGVVRDAAGAPLHYISQLQDITERKQVEDKLRQAQKMEAVGQLTAGIAHDFNNVLGAVVSNLDLVSEQLTADPVAVGRHTQEAIDAAMSGAELVKRLLAFSRQQPLQTRPTDMKETIASMVPLLRPSLGERIEIKTAIAADLWPAMADAAQVESALLNLAINARDAMPDGGVFSLHASNAHVNGDSFQANDDLKAGDYVVIAVTDSGTGMASDVVERAFEPFFTTKGVGAGSGLGLSMVLGTMQQLGGSAQIYSELGHGTTIRLFLPRATAVADTAPVHDADTALSTGTERILLVEDNELIRNGVEVMIRSLGYAVAVARDADAALALWDRGERFDLVFSDIILPGRYNGVGLARELRARDPHIKILLTSGFASPEEVSGDVARLGLEVLQKPYRKALLASFLRAVLERQAC